ncbi:[Pyruvate dehydrogenase (acetyl-transferring)] kinase isozyme 2, mitochondrial [Trichoplax sp. H2]|uniref:Protein-serine/threonine kinase n=1 Tax=Trichoplax adhaerens TaxID=10228 RepID=B3RPM0_TRIAD|nr:hypothetical protein TRIADDRAFT_20860 [Trichoplax adhaerens]EDV27658.1 hypothetical protein TRIADDRAFT_20860 [Trichoplax adhaerens]RDD45299.1 [Pyruvate dehydrogenase (acetyl-transferring)] kinase isozyme 2, mitochondrial [Trichoplax sp. H2]|eukprot:XP_002109492.1 hypothetical protein TRIADDRAFT_20860 [Trichoplax adhaerens]
MAAQIRQRSADVIKYINRYSQYTPLSLSIKQLMDFGRHGSILNSYKFLSSELPIRLAHIMKELRYLPVGLLDMPSVQRVDNWYATSLIELIDFRDQHKGKSCEVTAKNFTNLVANIRQRHNSVVETMAQGIIELKLAKKDYNLDQHRLQYFLDRFYTNRMSIRLLITQHNMLFGEENAEKKHIGCIDPSCNLSEIVASAVNNASELCDQYYMVVPPVDINEANAVEPGSGVDICYIPSHLHYMVFELLKNSMRAVVENHQNNLNLPPIQVTITKGEEDILIRICDRGGGIPISKLEDIYSYMYSTAPQPPSLDLVARSETVTPLAGFGVGLPLSRLYARYLNGDLKLSPLEGYGMDAYIYLKRFSVKANEVLPVFGEAASQQYRVRGLSGDWTASASNRKDKSG